VINFSINLVLVQTALREAAMGLSTSVCAMGQVVALSLLLKRRIGPLPWGEIARSVGRSAAATAIMALAVLAVDDGVDGSLRPLFRLVILVCTGGVAYLAAAFVLRCQEMREMLKK